MTGLHEQFFSFVCGQSPGRSWLPGGELLPFCQRCTGLYTGAAVGAILQVLCRPRSSPRFLWIHGFFLLQMVPLGFHLVPQGPSLRTLSGFLFALGVVAFLRANNGSRSHSAVERDSRRIRLYTLGVVLGLLIVPVSARWGGTIAHSMLTWFSTIGAAVLLFLVLANLKWTLTWLHGLASYLVRCSLRSTPVI